MLQAQIREEMKKAMLAKDEVRLRTMRGLIAAFTNELLNLKRKPTDELSDDEVITVVKRAVKQRKDSIEQFRAGNREDLAADEEAELAVLEPLLPRMAGHDEIKAVAEKKKTELGIADTSKLGILVGAVMKEFKGNADGAEVKSVVEEILS
jgi:uncharacterized protein YqeY